MKLPFWPNPKGYRDIELGLSRVYQLLERLGNPHEKLPPTIHIAGTNGKGSTLAFLKTIFEEGGYAVHSYTSPHLVEFNERIVLQGQKISDEFLNECLRECKTACETAPAIDVTYFEGITVAAFLAFSKVKADILLLETGLGGRLDATNVISKNLLSIITPISFDHTEFLGDSIEKIAFEKAGIIKAECPVVIGKQDPQALEVIKKRAAELNCETKIFGKDWMCKTSVPLSSKSTQTWEYLLDKGTAFLAPMPSLSGIHQIENASTAITAALTQTALPITFEQIKSALTKTIWPARLQKITHGKYFNLLKKNQELIVDGSHNQQGATTLKEFLKNKKGKKILIFSMLKDKDCTSFLATIKDEIDLLIACEIADEVKSRKPEEIYKIAKDLKINCIIAKNFDDAFKLIPFDILSFLNLANTTIIIAGSLYQAGNFLQENEKN